MSLWGVARSLRIYRNHKHLSSLNRFLREGVPGAGVVFDIGAHVGDRVVAFRRMGARVVAVEPNATLAKVLTALHLFDSGVTVVRAGCGAAPGRAVLRVNSNNPTVSTLSEGFLAATAGARGWEGQVWDRAAEVEVVTLDQLVQRFGTPDFVKIDVEGYEAEVLAGLSPGTVRNLSFEITTAAREAGLAALERARALGFVSFRLTLGESHAWATEAMTGAEMTTVLRDLPDEANSGDVFASV